MIDTKLNYFNVLLTHVLDTCNYRRDSDSHRTKKIMSWLETKIPWLMHQR